MKIISDEKELRWFFDNVAPELKPNEVYFLSMSARDKYLTTEERKQIGLSRTEMFAKNIVKDKNWEKFVRAIRRMECDDRGYTTRNNTPIPQKATVCYFNINPSDSFKAINLLNNSTNNLIFEITQASLHGKNIEDSMKKINRVNSTLMTCYQQATGTKHWVDFDLDVDKGWDIYNKEAFKEFLKNKGVTKYFWIDTKSGYHLLISKKQLNFNPKDIIDYLNMGYSNYTYCEYGKEKAHEMCASCEIILNKNAMIPLPGTFQGGHSVTILNKGDD